jgi:hypothetical protein
MEYEPVSLKIAALVDLPYCLLELTKTGIGGTLLDGLLRNCALYHNYLRAVSPSHRAEPYFMVGLFLCVSDLSRPGL